MAMLTINVTLRGNNASRDLTISIDGQRRISDLIAYLVPMLEWAAQDSDRSVDYTLTVERYGPDSPLSHRMSIAKAELLMGDILILSRVIPHSPVPAA